MLSRRALHTFAYIGVLAAVLLSVLGPGELAWQQRPTPTSQTEAFATAATANTAATADTAATANTAATATDGCSGVPGPNRAGAGTCTLRVSPSGPPPGCEPGVIEDRLTAVAGGARFEDARILPPDVSDCARGPHDPPSIDMAALARARDRERLFMQCRLRQAFPGAARPEKLDACAERRPGPAAPAYQKAAHGAACGGQEGGSSGSCAPAKP
jgi:hypothetical protein